MLGQSRAEKSDARLRETAYPRSVSVGAPPAEDSSVDWLALFRRRAPGEPIPPPSFAPPRFEPWFVTSAGEVLRAEVPKETAYDHWLELRRAVRDTGRWPVIVGPEDRAHLAENGHDEWDFDVAALLREADRRDAETVVSHRLAEFFEDGDEEEEASKRSDPDFRTDFPAGDLGPFEPHSDRPLVSSDSSAVFVIATLPTPNGWEAPAHLGYGGWNDYPLAEDHVALLRRWHERDGAEVVVLGGDVVELRPRAPLTDPAEAKRLAREWFAYSSDNVTQGHGSVQALAQYLLGAGLWYSWWD